MGRAKRKLELLSNLKERSRTFERRMKGLKKMAYELKTLCDVEMCLIVDSAPKSEKGNHPNQEPQIWPSDPDQIRKLIFSYRNQPADDTSIRSNLFTFYEAQNQKIEREITKLKKKNVHDIYPTWDSRYNAFSKEQLDGFGDVLAHKLQFLKTKIETMKANSFHESKPLSDTGYYHKQLTTQNELVFPSHEFVVGSCNNSYEGLITTHNPVVNLSTENEPCYAPLEDLYSINCHNGYIDWPFSDNIEPGTEQFITSTENPMVNLSIENDACYAQFEDLYSSNFNSDYIDWTVSDNIDLGMEPLMDQEW